jgi:dTDP-4-amino-4,6-dideoxygalactose transaminase
MSVKAATKAGREGSAEVHSSTRLPEFLPFHRPSITEAEISEVVDTLRSGWLTLGPRTQRFEEAFAQRVGAKRAVGVSSCTAGLHLSLLAMGVGPGDEVITSPYTFPSTISSILYTGATPVLVDTLEDYPNIDAEAVAAAISSKTKVVLPIHFAGAACDMDRLTEIADAAGVRLLEDAAHALPTTYKGRTIGGTADAAVFSLYAGKNMTTGEGGMVTTDDEGLADEIKCLRLHGISRDAWKRYTSEGSWYYEVSSLGFKYNMTDIAAAIGLRQIERLDEMQERRMHLIRAYDDVLSGIAGLLLPRPADYTDSSWHLYVVRIDPDVIAAGRSEVIEELKADNIGTSVHFIPAHHHPFFQERLGCKETDLPNASRLYESAISLPLFPDMEPGVVSAVAASLARILQENRR